MTTTILKSAPQREFRARDELERRGISAEVPSEKRRRRFAKGGTEWTIRPIMRGYVAVRASGDLGTALYAMQSETHRRDIVGCVGTVRDEAMQAVREISGRELDADGNVPLPTPVKPGIGSKVTVHSGMLAGLTLTVTALHGRYFSANLLGKTYKLPYTCLHPG